MRPVEQRCPTAACKSHENTKLGQHVHIQHIHIRHVHIQHTHIQHVHIQHVHIQHVHKKQFCQAKEDKVALPQLKTMNI